jgi:nucleoid-associated protein Lsr2
VAQKVEVQLIDDLDGGQAEETVSFSLDGVQYEIDLSAKNAGALRDHLAVFVGAARKAGGGRRSGRGRGRAESALGRPSSHEVREWAKEHGMKVNERGRIPTDVYVKFQQAQAS